MGNTFIEPGDWTFEEMLREIKHGIYIKSFMEWNIDDKRLNQRYVGLEAYMIENGKVGEAVKDPVFEITTPNTGEALTRVQMTCNIPAALVERGIRCRGHRFILERLIFD